jgi:hypothetical protein
MQDVSIRLDNKPGTLAQMGECLGQAGVSVEGGGADAQNREWPAFASRPRALSRSVDFKSM